MKIKGTDAEQKFKSVEAALNRLARKIKPESTCFVPPLPVSFYKNDFTDDVLGRYIFPTSGKITNVVIYLQFADKKQPIQITANLYLGDTQTSQAFTMHNRQIIEALDLDIHVGTRLEFILNSKAEALKAVWLGFLYKVNVQAAEIHKVAINQLGAIDEGDNTEI